MIYLDHQATTPCDPRVIKAMEPYWREQCSNPASRHQGAYEIADCVTAALDQIASLLNVSGDEIVITSGATEADNLALKGVFEGHPKSHIITQVTEHKAILDVVHHLVAQGHEATILSVDCDGKVSPQAVEQAIQPNTLLCSIMAANNEIGTLQPLKEIASICHQHGVLFHTDAAQALGEGVLDADDLGFDLCSMSSHKIYGPKGIGALFVREGVEILTQIHGGGHQRGLRSGTLPVPLIVGFAEACRIAREEGATFAKHILTLRDRLLNGLKATIPEVELRGSKTDRLACNLSLGFPFTRGDSLLNQLPEIALSTGSACTSADIKPSHVLCALGLSEAQCHATLRFSLGRDNTPGEIDYVIERLSQAVAAERALNYEWEEHLLGDSKEAEND